MKITILGILKKWSDMKLKEEGGGSWELCGCETVATFPSPQLCTARLSLHASKWWAQTHPSSDAFRLFPEKLQGQDLQQTRFPKNSEFPLSIGQNTQQTPPRLLVLAEKLHILVLRELPGSTAIKPIQESTLTVAVYRRLTLYWQ